LQLGEFIHEQPAFPEVEYKFKHALTQEVAYNSVLTERRKSLHERAGRAIESLNTGRLEDHFDELAHHYSRSDNVPKAVEYLHLAAAQALNRSHYDEAGANAAAALDLVGRLTGGAGRLQAELELQMITARASTHTMGFNAPQVERALRCAESICHEIGNPAQMLRILSDLRIYYRGFGKLSRVRGLAAQMVEIAEKEGGKALLAEAYFHWGDTLMSEGQLRDALTYLNRAIAYCEPGQKVAADLDALTMSLNRAGPTLWALGYADQALDACRRALEHTASLNHPASIAVARFGSSLVRMLRRDREAEQEAEALAAFANEYGSSYYDWVALGIRSTALLEQGLVTEAVPGLSQLVELSRWTGVKLVLPHYLARLAQAHGMMSEPSRGLELISEAFAEMEDSAEQYLEPELYRLKGDLLLMQDALNAGQAEKSFRKAIEVARRQEAKFYELRATMSLARLLDKHGKRDEAYKIFADIYNWFTEGFDTVDLKEAKALLDELAG
jgi:tetratricopeptide (TPR) repeat protein